MLEKGYFESYMAFISPRQEQRVEKSHKQNEWLENVLVVVFVMGAVLYGLAGVAIAVAGLLFSLLAVVVGAFAVSNIFKDS